MDEQGKSYRNRCCCFSLRTGCILIGIAEIFLIPAQLMSLFSNVNIKIYFDIDRGSGIYFLRVAILIGLIVALPLIYGAFRRNRFYLWPCVSFNAVAVFVVLFVYYVIEIREAQSPVEIDVVRIYTALLYMFTTIQALLMLVVYRYIRKLHEDEYNSVVAPAGAENVV